jgi:alanyl-tRNA synthetase
VQEREGLLKKSAGVFKVPEHQLPQTSERFFKEWKEQRKEVEKLKEYFAKGKAEELVDRSKKEGVVEEKVEEDSKTLMKIGGLIAKHKGAMVIITNSEGDFVCVAGEGAKKNAKELMKRLKGAKGGGSETLVAGKLAERQF